MNDKQMRAEFEDVDVTFRISKGYKNSLIKYLKDAGHAAAASSRDTELKAMQYDMEEAVDGLNQTIREVEELRAAASSRDELVSSLQEKLRRAEWFIDKEGYRRCDIAACNCPYWHGGNWQERFREISDIVQEAGISTNGILLKDAIKIALDALAEAKAQGYGE